MMILQFIKTIWFVLSVLLRDPIIFLIWCIMFTLVVIVHVPSIHSLVNLKEAMIYERDIHGCGYTKIYRYETFWNYAFGYEPFEITNLPTLK